MITRHAKPFSFDTMVPEAVLAAQWAETIRPQDRNMGFGQNYSLDYQDAEYRKKQSDARRLAQMEKQRAFAAECVPLVEGDETIIFLYGEGANVPDIAKQTGRPQGQIRARLAECHPSASSLK